MTDQPPLVQALLRPQAYPHHPEKIELVQTHISLVFLTGDYVYKVKKPVDLGFVDYSTLEKRKHFCHQEVTLNRRGCPDIYLDVVPIAQEENGIRVEGNGEPIEYAVKMRQLPQETTMEYLLAHNQVSSQMVERVARRVAEFHRKAETNEAIASYGDVTMVATNTGENYTQTEKYIGVTISPEAFEAIKAFTEGFIRENGPLFNERMKDGRIRDCHGDLHAAHVCFTDGICIFDCIEFNERFRYGDVASEIAFLAMDLDYRDRPDLAQHFVETYMEETGDSDILKLLHFYKCYRAYVRGKVACFKLDDPHISADEKEKAIAVASRYFDLAQSYASKHN